MRPLPCPLSPAALAFAALLCVTAASCAPAESHDANATNDRVIGVLQCDQYLTRISACIREIPEDRRATLTTQARETFATWKAAAAHPQHRTTLPQACTISLELAREELAPLGCRL
jgi:non-ribosomal peptide synthetase component F